MIPFLVGTKFIRNNKDSKMTKKNPYLNHFIALVLVLGVFSPSYAQKYRTGCVLDKDKYATVPLAAPLMRGDYRNLPAKVSLRKYAPIPKNQGAYGTCVGWSAAYAARTVLYARQKNITDPISVTQNAFSPFFLYERAKPSSDINCQEGTSLVTGLDVIKRDGVVKYQDFSDRCGKLVTSKLRQDARAFKVQDYRKLFKTENDTRKVQLVKKSLAEKKPVIIGMQCCTESFLNSRGKDIWIKNPKEDLDPDGGHALTVVGYDDKKHGGAFELMNSWGTLWGDNGFIWVKYSDFQRYCFEAYEMIVLQPRQITLSGKVKFTLSAGFDMQAEFKDGYYQVNKPYYSGTLFRMYIANNEPAYVYAFSSDLSRKTYKIFPHSQGMSPYLGYSSNNVAIPDEDLFIKMDNTQGMDYFCVLYSAEKLDIAKIMKQVEMEAGDFQTRVKKVLSSKLIPGNEINYSSNGGISFQGISKKGKVVPIIVAIRHL